MTCANCGTPQKDNEEFCLACGAKYPEINNINQPTSENNKREVGNFSGVFSVFDSQNDATNKKGIENNTLYDVLKNKKVKNKPIVESVVEELVPEQLVAEEAQVQEQEQVQVQVEEFVTEQTFAEEPVAEEAQEQEQVQVQVEEFVTEQTFAEEPVAEEVQVQEQEQQVTEFVSEPELEETTVENNVNVLESFIAESEIDTENNVFKDSDDFNVSLSDLEELEKTLVKDKVETFDTDFSDADIEVFESFDDALKSANDVSVDDFNIDDINMFLDEIIEAAEEHDVEDNDNIESVESVESVDTPTSNEVAFNNLDVFAKPVAKEESVIEVDDVNDFDFRMKNVEDTGVESSSAIEDINDLNLDGISFDGINLGEINLDEINLDEINLDDIMLDEINLDDVDLNELSLNIEESFEDTFEDTNIEVDDGIANENIENTENTDDFIKLDGVDDIISELNIEEFDDIDEFLEKNKFVEEIDFVEAIDIEEPSISDTSSIETEDLKNATSESATKDSSFDFSLDELDNLEKMLMAEKTKSSISDIEQALLSGEDVVHDYTSKKTKESIETEEFNATEPTLENVQLDTTESDLAEKIEEVVEKLIIKNDLNISGNISGEKLNKVDRALKLRTKGEEIDFLQKNKRDFDIDQEAINEIVATVKRLKREVEANNDKFDDELLSIEEDILKEVKDIEKHEKMSKAEHIDNIDDIDDIDFSNFVEEDEITDTDNILKADVDENIQSAIDQVIQQAKERVENAKTDTASEFDEDVQVDTDEKVEEDKVAKDVNIQLDTVESEILANLDQKSDQTHIVEESTASEDIESLLLDVIGSFEQVKPKEPEAKKEKPEFKPQDEEVKEFVENLESVQGFKYDTELVREYETLRLDLEFFFPNTQEVEKLDRDIQKLLDNGKVDELASNMEHDLLLGDLGDFDFEELNEKDISDALLEIREMKEKEDKSRLRREERQKKLKRTRARFNKIYTYGGLFKKIDATIVHAVLITLVCVGYAGYSTYKTENFSVNMLSRTEKIEITEQLWDSLNDNAKSFVSLQEDMKEYVAGTVTQDEMIAQLNAYLDENYIARQKFDAVDIPTYSEYKYRIDKFLADRMTVTNNALKDVMAGKQDSNAIQSLIKLKAEVKSFDEIKNEFYRQMGISF